MTDKQRIENLEKENKELREAISKTYKEIEELISSVDNAEIKEKLNETKGFLVASLL